jgi:hypothetical protein
MSEEAAMSLLGNRLAKLEEQAEALNVGGVVIVVNDKVHRDGQELSPEEAACELAKARVIVRLGPVYWTPN